MNISIQMFTLSPDAPRSPYRPHDYYTGTVHWGQRKLYLAEERFLALAKPTSSSLIIYVGAASGQHLPMLLDRYPGRWHLYDKAPFDRGLNPYRGGRVEIFNEYFTEETLKRYTGVDLLIMDLRIMPVDRTSESNRRARIEDLELQKRIYLGLRPRMASFKFALPYPGRPFPDEFEYLDGEIWLQAFAPQTTTETRLIVTGIATKTYSCLQYEEQLAYVNNHVRPSSNPDEFFIHDGWDAQYERSLLTHEESQQLNRTLKQDFPTAYQIRKRQFEEQKSKVAGVPPNDLAFHLYAAIPGRPALKKMPDRAPMEAPITHEYAARDKLLGYIRACCLGLRVPKLPILMIMFPGYKLRASRPIHFPVILPAKLLEFTVEHLRVERPAEVDILMTYVDMYIDTPDVESTVRSLIMALTHY